MKGRNAGKIKKACSILNDKFAAAGVTQNTYVMDDEESWDLKKAMKEKNKYFQLVPTHIHPTNLAERVIQTFKSHFMAGLASLDPDFTFIEWDRLILQVELTLNLLRATKSNPKLSA